MDAEELDRILTAAAESLATEHEWVKESALTERAFALGVHAALVRAVSPELRPTVDRAQAIAVMNTTFVKEGDDPFRGTTAERLLERLRRNGGGDAVEVARVVNELLAVIDQREQLTSHHAAAARDLLDGIADAPLERIPSLVRLVEEHLRGLYRPDDPV